MVISRDWSDRMAKRATIILRVDGEKKMRFEEAAGRAGLTLTSFLLKGAERHARELEKKGAARDTNREATKTGKPGACPAFFRMTCLEAGRGGNHGYDWAGRTLVKSAPGLVEWRTAKELKDKFLALRGAIERRDDAGVLGWFDGELPRCMALIPRRRRKVFLDGVYREVDETGGDVLIPMRSSRGRSSKSGLMRPVPG
jgi:hypothetical protein